MLVTRSCKQPCT